MSSAQSGRGARSARLAGAAALLLWSVLAAAELPDPHQLLVKADSYRQAYEETELEVRLQGYKGDALDKEGRYHVALKGSDRALVKRLDGRDYGQKILMTSHGLWLRMPRTTRVLRITPIQRVLGEASYGDLGRMRWQDDYQAELVKSDRGTIDAVPVVQLLLHAKSDGAIYPRMDLWVAIDDARPIEAVFYLPSGKAFKRAQFGKPERVNGRRLIRSTVYYDELKPQSHTVMIVDKVIASAHPDRLFTLEALSE